MKIDAIITLAIRDGKSYLEIKDGSSRILFFEASIENEKMLQILSGQAGIHIDADVSDLESVGKKKELIRYSFEISKDELSDLHKNKNSLNKKMEENTPVGYTTDYYLGSKDNFSYDKSGVITVHQTAYRYVDANEPKA